jgi:hypothetical protein
MNNPMQQGMPIQCPNCRQPFTAPVESIIDAGRDPGAKARFLSRRTNIVRCPNCGATVGLNIPLVYHDHTKDLLMIFFPMELNLPTQERERMVGEMTRAIMNSLPQEERRGYLFNPITPLTLDGMIETILQKDGITPEMMEAQKQKVRLAEQFFNATSEDLPDLVTEYDADLDAEFFQIMTLSAEAALSSGNSDGAEALLQRRDEILVQSSYGQEALARAELQEQVIHEVADYLNAAGGRLELDEFIDYVVDHAEEDEYLQAIVGLARPALNYAFFNAMTERADREQDSFRASQITQARDRLLELSQVIDQQQQMAVQSAQGVLQALLQAPDIDRAIQEMLPYMDETFLSVLTMSIQQAEQSNDLLNGARLRSAYEKVIQQMRASAPPEVQFINALLSEEDPLEARLMLTERAAEFGQPLLDYLDAFIQTMSQRDAGELVQQLQDLRAAAASIIGE